jgi:hypothetical protein
VLLTTGGGTCSYAPNCISPNRRAWWRRGCSVSALEYPSSKCPLEQALDVRDDCWVYKYMCMLTIIVNVSVRQSASGNGHDTHIQLMSQNTLSTSSSVLIGGTASPLAFGFMRKWSNLRGRVKGFQGMRLER